MKHQIQTNTGILPFTQILRAVDTVVAAIIKKCREQTDTHQAVDLELKIKVHDEVLRRRTPSVTKTIPWLIIQKPAAWPALNPDFAVRGDNFSKLLLPCAVSLLSRGSHDALFSYSNFPEEPRVWSERVYYYKEQDDLNYGEIHSGFTGLLEQGAEDRQIAEDMLAILDGKKPGTDYHPKDLAFLTGTVALMFGMEASRFPSALLINLLMLDLIQHGKQYGRTGAKAFSFATAFHRVTSSGEALNWDNGRDSTRTDTLEHEWYGGKYPYAVHGTGSGNMAMREQMAKGKEGEQYRQNFLSLPQRHAVPRREVALVIHWVESNLSDEGLKGLTFNSLCDLLFARLKAGYLGVTDKVFALPENPRPETGTHRPGVKTEDISDQVFWYGKGKYYHINPSCKLLPGYDQNTGGGLFMSEYALPSWAMTMLGIDPRSSSIAQYSAIKDLSVEELAVRYVSTFKKETEATLSAQWYPNRKLKQHEKENVARQVEKRAKELSRDKIEKQVASLQRVIEKLKTAGGLVIQRGLPQTGPLENAMDAEKVACLSCIPLNHQELVEEYRKKLEEKPVLVKLEPSDEGGIGVSLSSRVDVGVKTPGTSHTK
ncbi:hypothetical protein [Corallococcus exercitus]|uniref:hypothetical protein n=1 Tax=Corallococcus exercitus TaxID=2316736 RepID=UPI0035D48927